MELMMKNLLAVIGFFVVAQKSYEIYCDYQDLKQENELLKKKQHQQGTT
jgi:hypothetical protein